MLKKFNRGASKDVYKIVTGDESWIYSYEPESKQQSTVWVFQDKPNPTKVVRARITSKKMVACFFGKTGHIATVPLEDRRTEKKNKRRRIVLHHDNPSSYTSAQTRDYLSTQNIELNKLRGQRFSSAEEAIEAFKNHVLKIPHSEWNKRFENWFNRMQKCLDHRGEYFEEQ
ncbi:hypothetical protein GWI33_000580 [Rhynchophorus ferrugineus]|uniref:Transposase n=1 Tax=Rhynchophorus ferrugineus TaxID=354439 RepID=A0A834M262_RHYFE|nr:hypothetical protein GWI33_000580 [Rhynchophorus ferrugineus]